MPCFTRLARLRSKKPIPTSVPGSGPAAVPRDRSGRRFLPTRRGLASPQCPTFLHRRAPLLRPHRRRRSRHRRPSRQPPTPAPPPGYVAYGNSPTPLASLRRVGGLSIAIITLTTIAAIATVLTTILTAGVAEDAEDYLDGELSDDEFRERHRTGQRRPADRGTRHARHVRRHDDLDVPDRHQRPRLPARTRRGARCSPIFGWMLPPFVLYVIPFLVLRELWKASDPTDANDPESWRSSTPTTPSSGRGSCSTGSPRSCCSSSPSVRSSTAGWPPEASSRSPRASTNSAAFAS